MQLFCQYKSKSFGISSFQSRGRKIVELISELNIIYRNKFPEFLNKILIHSIFDNFN